MIEPIIDVSKWQGEIDAKKMLDAGTLAMYIKAGGTDKYNGASYTDRRFRENAEKFSQRVPCGYYYFFYPHFDGAKQAKYFCQLLKSVKWNLPPAIDVERNPHNVSKARFQKEIKEFVDVVENELNIKSVIYTRGWFWNDNVGSPAWAKDYKLWIARYGEYLSHPWNNAHSQLQPRPWTDFWLWQYSADKNKQGHKFGGASSGIDKNKVNMTLDELYAFANWGEQEQPDTEEAPTPDNEEAPDPDHHEDEGNGEEKPEEPAASSHTHKGFLRRGYTALRLRSRPTTHQSNTVGSIKRGYNFTVHKEIQIGDDLWWLIELPDKTVGWGARRYQSINFLEPAI
ncbi:MAG: GH25 family lysozyme [Chloroflexota bacterium]|nr:GH25 family lysozyme [Chloroflexota bacterium]